MIHELRFKSKMVHAYTRAGIAVWEAFHFLLAAAMHEGGNPRFGKFDPLNVTEVDGKWRHRQQVPAIWHKDS